MDNQPKQEGGIVKSVLTAYLILALHVLLIAGLGILVIFFRGIVQYMLWIVLVGLVLIGTSGFFFYRRMKAEGRNLKEMMRSSMFRNRSVEVSLLGGIASVKLGKPEHAGPVLISDAPETLLQLEDSETAQIRELGELARLLEKNLITLEEFNQSKRLILGSGEKK